MVAETSSEEEEEEDCVLPSPMCARAIPLPEIELKRCNAYSAILTRGRRRHHSPPPVMVIKVEKGDFPKAPSYTGNPSDPVSHKAPSDCVIEERDARDTLEDSDKAPSDPVSHKAPSDRVIEERDASDTLEARGNHLPHLKGLTIPMTPVSTLVRRKHVPVRDFKVTHCEVK